MRTCHNCFYEILFCFLFLCGKTSLMAQNWFEGFVENLDVDYTYAFIAEYAEEGGDAIHCEMFLYPMEDVQRVVAFRKD